MSLLGSIYQLWHKQDVLSQAAQQLSRVKKENNQLQKQLKMVATKQFIEEQARDNLFLAKPGEHEVIISESPSGKNQSAQKKIKELPNWQQWIAIFF